MVNWSGTLSITTQGTTLTGATSTSATNSGASWGASGNLVNQYIRILTGTGSGQTVLITASTSTQVTVGSWPGGTPSAGSTYEIVLIFNNSDVVTANLTLSTGIITEIQNSSNLFIQSGHSITFSNSCIVRWGMSESTIPTIIGQNFSTQGTSGFWTGIVLASTLSNTPNISYVIINGAATALNMTPSTGLGNASTVHHIWTEANSTACIQLAGAAITSNTSIKNVFSRYSSTSPLIFGSTNANFTQRYDTCWLEYSNVSGVTWGSSGGVLTQIVRNCVFINAIQDQRVNTATTQTQVYAHNYLGTGLTNNSGGGSVLGGTSGSNDGYQFASANVTVIGNFINPTNGTAAPATIKTSSNDIISWVLATSQGIVYGANTGTIRLSDNDYLAGNNNAAFTNVDTTASTTSTASPHQYAGLTSTRTNARGSRNHPLVVDNVSLGTAGSNSITITFDSQNGAAASQKTTVNVDSSSGQNVLSVTATTMFLVGMLIEIGYGTARSEFNYITAITAGVSLTLETNLTFSHTAAQGDTVSITLRYPALAFVRYGTSTGSYNMETMVPDSRDFGLYYTGVRTLLFGSTFAFKRTGHSVTLNNLKSGTIYYCRCFAYSPLGELLDQGAENTFTTTGGGSSATVGYGFVS